MKCPSPVANDLSALAAHRVGLGFLKGGAPHGEPRTPAPVKAHEGARSDPASEKLQEEQGGSGFSYTWVKTALQTAGLVAKEARRGPHRTARPRRPLPGMLLLTAALLMFLSGLGVAQVTWNPSGGEEPTFDDRT